MTFYFHKMSGHITDRMTSQQLKLSRTPEEQVRHLHSGQPNIVNFPEDKLRMQMHWNGIMNAKHQPRDAFR